MPLTSPDLFGPVAPAVEAAGGLEPEKATGFGALAVSTLFLALAILSGCHQKAAAPPPRYAVVRFENLSGDPSLEWMGRAASELLSGTLAGAMDGPVIATTAMQRLSATLGPRPGGAPGISSERIAAQMAGASHVISGYIERSSTGSLRITGTEEDIGTGKTINSVSVTGAAPMQTLTLLAHALSPKAGAYQTSSEEALRLYSIGREATPENAVASLEQAVQTDSGFGAAWEALIQITVARGDRQSAENLIAKARQRKLDNLTMANLDLDQAVLGGDPKARLVALRRVSDLSPGDTVLRRSLAEQESAGGQFAEAAADWGKLRDVLTADPDAWNQLGYTQAWSGDYAAAVQTMEAYARLRPADPNPLDSLGDVHFMYRKFREAGEAYSQAHAKAPGFLDGGDLYKAAWARFMAGNKAGAEATFVQFRKTQEKNETFPLVLADWLYRTGRQTEAVAELRKRLDLAPSAAKQPMLEQLAVWELLAGDRTAAEKDAEAGGPPATPGSFLIRFAVLPSAPAAEWESRATHMISAPGVVGLRRLAVGYALLLDGKKEAALPVWKQIAEESPPTDFTLRSIYTRLMGERPKLADLPNPSSVNPFAALVDKL